MPPADVTGRAIEGNITCASRAVARDRGGLYWPAGPRQMQTYHVASVAGDDHNPLLQLRLGNPPSRQRGCCRIWATAMSQVHSAKLQAHSVRRCRMALGNRLKQPDS
jgi:hypothetical protein